MVIPRGAMPHWPRLRMMGRQTLLDAVEEGLIWLAEARDLIH